MPGLANQSKARKHSPQDQSNTAPEQGEASNSQAGLAQTPAPSPKSAFELKYEARLERISNRLQRLTGRVHDMNLRIGRLRDSSQEGRHGTRRSRGSHIQKIRDNEHKDWGVSQQPARQQEDEGEHAMSGALPTENGSPDVTPEAPAPKMHSTRAEVIARIRLEEANSFLTLHDPDRVRSGSCSGFTISQMFMMRTTANDVVLPNLGSIEKYDVRSLKAWLVERDSLQKSESASRTEKLLHCLHLLKTGNRYESIAVIFSQSPRRIRDGCLEVMDSLSKMYDLLVDEYCEQEVDAVTWGILKRFDRNADGRGAHVYYGFSWTRVMKVLVALNLFLGLSQSASPEFDDSEGGEQDGAISAAIGNLERIAATMGNASQMDLSRTDVWWKR